MPAGVAFCPRCGLPFQVMQPQMPYGYLQPAKPKSGVGSVIAFTVGTLAVLAACFLMLKAKTEAPAKAVPDPHAAAGVDANPLPTTGATIDTSPDQIISQFKSGAEAARTALLGRKVRVTAYVTMVSSDLRGSGDVAVMFQSSTYEADHTMVTFWYDGSYASLVNSLRSGDRVTCEGTLRDQEVSGDIQFQGISLK